MVRLEFDQRFLPGDLVDFPQDILNIYLNDQRLLYVVADHLGQVHYLADYQSNDSTSVLEILQQVFAADAKFRSTYASIKLYVNSDKSVLSPADLLQTKEDNAALNVFLKPGFKEKRFFDHPSPSSIVNTFSLPIKLEEEVLKMFPGAQIHHRHTCLLNIWSESAINLPGERLFADLDTNRLSIAFFRENNLQFINQFRIANEDDILYYIMLIYNQFELDPKEDTIHVSGDIILKPKGVHQLQRFVQNVQIIQTPPITNQGAKLSDQNATRYYVALSGVQFNKA